MVYLTDVFFPSFIVYSVLFLLETATLYLYWYGWDSMQGAKKGLHLFLGFLLNVFAFFIMIVPNSWATFQASPVVITEGSMWAKAWVATWNPTWWPVNVHRLIANVVLGGFICGAYAGLKYLMAQNKEERVHYDWMGYVGNFIGVFGMLPLPFAGYWLMREIYQYNQQMGITLMGGFLSWLFILQAMLIGILFLGANYYFWLGIMYRIPGAEAKYRKPILAMLIILLMCLGVWMTPHSLVASLEEARKMGGTHHPMLGVLGVMSAKMTVVNVMILVTFMSFVMYWRAGKQETATWAKAAKVGQGVLLATATVIIIVLGVWGYFVPAITRINYFSTTQVLVMLFVLLTITPLTALVLKSAKTTTEMVWGKSVEKRQDDDGNGLGCDAAPRRLRPRVERGHGHLAHDPDGLRAVIFKGPLARIRSDARHLTIRLFTRAGLCSGLHVVEYLSVLSDGRVYLLGRLPRRGEEGGHSREGSCEGSREAGCCRRAGAGCRTS